MPRLVSTQWASSNECKEKQESADQVRAEIKEVNALLAKVSTMNAETLKETLVAARERLPEVDALNKKSAAIARGFCARLENEVDRIRNEKGGAYKEFMDQLDNSRVGDLPMNSVHAARRKFCILLVS